MWDRAHSCTAVAVVVAAVALSATLNNHYTLPAELRALEAETRRLRSGLADLTARPLPFLEAETAALQRLSAVDHEIARAEADALLLQAKLLEIIAGMGPEEQAAVPPKIKSMLAAVDVLSKDAALALVPELEAARARERDAQTNSSAAAASAPSAEAAAAAAKARARSELAHQLDELVAEVVAWRSSPGPAGAAAAGSAQDAKGGTKEGSKESSELAALRTALNAERKHLLERSKAARTSTIASMRDKVEQPIPETRIISKDFATDHSGRHWLIVATDSARTHSPLSDFLSEKHYGAPAQIEQGNCNQVGRVGSRVQGLRSAVQWLSGVQRSQGVEAGHLPPFDL